VTGHVPRWLNVGVGEYYQLGWHNVDQIGSPHPVDEHVDITGPLPWPAGSITRVYMGHVLEHLPKDACVDLLVRLHVTTAPEGEIMVVNPDMVHTERLHADGVIDDDWWRQIREGGCRWPGDEHQWLCEPDTLVWMLQTAGWRGVREIPMDLIPDIWPVAVRHPWHDAWQCAVQGIAADPFGRGTY